MVFIYFAERMVALACLLEIVYQANFFPHYIALDSLMAGGG
jgi:hypothetical protein